jgi:hypothetical protein
MNRPQLRRTRQPSTPLERGFYRLYRLSSLGSAAAIMYFIGYVFGGFGLKVTGVSGHESGGSSFYEFELPRGRFHLYTIGVMCGSYDVG